MNWQIILGLEVHVALRTDTKLFCSCMNRYGYPENTLVCPICLGMPGTLPCFHHQPSDKLFNWSEPHPSAGDLALRVAWALSSQVCRSSQFDRKNYFYPDMPRNYQLTQHFHPLASGGFLELKNGQRIAIQEMHLEDDAGRIVHKQASGIVPVDSSCSAIEVDFNRAGVPLLEIVTAPWVGTPELAVEFLRTLRDLLRYLKVSECKMEEGAFRCDANISIAPLSVTLEREDSGALSAAALHGLGKVELKNLNSFKTVQLALQYEVHRQARLVQTGQVVESQTRSFDAVKMQTYAMREKENSAGYRYIPCPDLPMLVLSNALWEQVAVWDTQAKLLPVAKQLAWIKQFALPEDSARLISLYPALEKLYIDAKGSLTAANIILNALWPLYGPEPWEIELGKLTSEAFSEIVVLFSEHRISMRSARLAFHELCQKGGSAMAVLKQMGLLLDLGGPEVEACALAVLKANPKIVALYRLGQKKVLNSLVNALRVAVGDRVAPKILKETLERLLAN